MLLGHIDADMENLLPTSTSCTGHGGKQADAIWAYDGPCGELVVPRCSTGEGTGEVGVGDKEREPACACPLGIAWGLTVSARPCGSSDGWRSISRDDGNS